MILGRHLDSTFRGWSATLATRVRLVIARQVLIFALPLDFHGRLQVIRSMFIHGALHGIEVSFLAEASLCKLRAAIVRVVGSRRQSLANTGAVLSLLDGPSGCDPTFCVVWHRFRMLRYIGQMRFSGFIGYWSMLLMGALVMVLHICFLSVLLKLVLFGLLMWLVV